MLDGDGLSALLYALATGDSDRAKNVVYVSDQLGDRERELLRPVVDDDSAAPDDRARRLGDAFRELGHRELANECYRLAFYLGNGAADLSANPLFAYFLAHRSGRLIDKWIHYFAVYHRHLARYRNTAVRVLEIGVSHGGSLDMWSHYLGPDATLVGVDIDEAARRLANPRLVVAIGDQADPDFLRRLDDEHGPFDVVIDDGGHTMEQQITSVETLFPRLTEGGTYLVEDAHTSYWPEFGGGLRREGTFVEWIKARIDDLHGFHLDDAVDPVWTAQVDAIHCYDSIVILDKKLRTPPFSEQTGTSDFVFAPRPVSALVGEMLATREAARSERDEERAAREQEHAAREQAEEELTVTRNDLMDTIGQVQAMRQTFSWRVTAPLRMLRRATRRD